MRTSQNKLSKSSLFLLLVTTILLGISIFVPIWRIDLDAPQYPEGLRLLIYANKLGGNVDIINGLNHYIGMKTLHTEDFIEFKILPFLIGAFSVLSLLALLIGKKRFFYGIFVLFILFGIVAMVDFWRWEYNYGHNLDPNAAIIVPGMAYQPPLIGFKQLLNFGAFSVPAIGGWLFVASGVLMLFVFLAESKLFRKKNLGVIAATVPFFLMVSSCAEVQPEKAKLNADNCDNCNMTISDAKFVSELITEKGRIYKFDDLSCMKTYCSENQGNDKARLYVADFDQPEHFLPVNEAVFVSGESIGSPMGGNVAAFSNRQSAENFAANRTVQILLWKDLESQ